MRLDEMTEHIVPGTVGHHWQHLAEVTTDDKNFATKGQVVAHNVSQQSVSTIKCLPRRHGSFVPDDETGTP